MTQNAIVTGVNPDGSAEAVVTRSTACGSNCGNCESCIFQNELKISALNRAGASPGQRVKIESKTSDVFRAVFLVYLMPLVLFLLGYLIGYLLEWREAACIAASFVFLIIGAGIVVLSQRRRKSRSRITFEITEIIDGGEK